MRIHALILAAGEGRRMGGPKALLDFRGASFLAAVAQALARPGVERTFAVVGHEAARVRAECGAAGVTFVENALYAQGMLTSVRAGLRAAEEAGAAAVLLHPVDHPAVAASTVDRVIE